MIRTNDNTPVGPSYALRKEAEDAMHQIDAKEYGYDWEPYPDIIAAVEKEVAARTVKSLSAPEKGLPSDNPGVTDKARSKQTTPSRRLP